MSSVGRIVRCVLSCALQTIAVVAVVPAARLTAGTTGCYALGRPTGDQHIGYMSDCPPVAYHDGVVAAGAFLIAYVVSVAVSRGAGPSVLRTGVLGVTIAFDVGLALALAAGQGRPWNGIAIAVIAVYVVGSLVLQLVRGTAASLLLGARTLRGGRYAWRGGDATPGAADIVSVLVAVALGVAAGLVAAPLLLQ